MAMPEADEFFDVVDRNDAVVGRAARREVHARGLLHRAVHVLVCDGSGRVFLQKRSMKKDIAPGLWDSSCSGHVDSGESYDAAAVRFAGGATGVLSGAATVPKGSPFQLDIRLFGAEGMLLLDIERERLELRRHDGGADSFAGGGDCEDFPSACSGIRDSDAGGRGQGAQR